MDDKYAHYIIVDIVDDAIVGSDVPGIGDTVATDQCLGMTKSGSWMFHYFKKECCGFLEEDRIGLDFFHFLSVLLACLE